MSQVCEVDQIFLLNVDNILTGELRFDGLVWDLNSAGVK